MRARAVRGIAVIVAFSSHSSSSPSASYFVIVRRRGIFAPHRPAPSSGNFSILRSTTTTSSTAAQRRRSRTRLHDAESTVDAAALLIIAGSGATSSLATWWRNANDPTTAERRERRRLAHDNIEFREMPWTDEELRMHDGTEGDGGYPILMAVKDRVYSTWAPEDGRRVLRPGVANIAFMAGRGRISVSWPGIYRSEETRRRGERRVERGRGGQFGKCGIGSSGTSIRRSVPTKNNGERRAEITNKWQETRTMMIMMMMQSVECLTRARDI